MYTSQGTGYRWDAGREAAVNTAADDEMCSESGCLWVAVWLEAGWELDMQVNGAESDGCF